MYISQVKYVELRMCSFYENSINPFMPNGISHHYQFEQSISVLRDVRWYFFYFFQILIENYARNSGDPDQTTRSVVSDLDLLYVPMSHKKDARHTWVKKCNYFAYLIRVAVIWGVYC